MIAQYDDEVVVPAAACIETESGFACWVQQQTGRERRSLEIEDGNNMFLLVRSGITAGEQVILDPLANVPDAQIEVAQTIRND